MKLSRGEKFTVVDSSGAEVDAISSTGLLTANNITVKTGGYLTFDGGAVKEYSEILSLSSGGLSPSTCPCYGVTTINMTGTDPSTSPLLLTMGAPFAGVRKTLVFNSTAAYINTIDVDLGAGVGVSGSTTNRFIAFSTLATVPQVVNLVGISTALWSVTSIDSTIAGGFSAATGIRAATAARTS